MDNFPHGRTTPRTTLSKCDQRSVQLGSPDGAVDPLAAGPGQKAGREAREMAVSPAEYVTVIDTVGEPCFRDLIELSWETGARVQELRKIEARFFDEEAGRVVFPPTPAKREEVPPCDLPDRTGRRRSCGGLPGIHPKGPILPNSGGNPWNKDSINCAFCRLQLALGRRALAERGVAVEKRPRFKRAGLDIGEWRRPGNPIRRRGSRNKRPAFASPASTARSITWEPSARGTPRKHQSGRRHGDPGPSPRAPRPIDGESRLRPRRSRTRSTWRRRPTGRSGSRRPEDDGA